DNDSSSEGDSSAGDARGSNSGETVVGSNEQDEDDTAIIPPSDILDNGCPVDDTIHWLVPGEDCSTFYYCVWGNLVEASCPPGLQFSFELQRCDFPEIVDCGSGEDTPVGGNDSESSSEEDRPAGDAPSNPESGENQPGGDEDAVIVPPSDLLDNGCPVDGNINWLVPSEDCSKFYYCVWGHLVEASCPAGLHFSIEYQRCETPEIAGCGSGEITPPGGNDNDSNDEEDTPAGGEGNDSSNEQNDDDAAPTPPSDLLENGCPVDGTIH
ncbi:carbohydrate-binding module family 14 protein, partial [Escherichia coli]|uniref:carbohydrate-binding module family 14 protein n=1 Tax=Escherichia coli TaxID=562 RepID=UPI00197CC5D0